MSEHMPHHPERHERAETPAVEAPEQHEHPGRHEHHKTPETTPADIEKLIEAVNANALGKDEISQGEQEQPHSEPAASMRQLRHNAYQHTLQKVRTHMGPRKRAFSRFIHKPVVESISEAGGRTAARPSGLFGGGLAALIGSSTVLFMSKYYGFRYNFFVFILLFVAGFAVGVAAEFLLHAFRHNKV